VVGMVPITRVFSDEMSPFTHGGGIMATLDINKQGVN